MARADHLNTKLLDSTTGAVSVTSGSFTPQADSILCVAIGAMVRGNSPADIIATANSTLSGGGLTWTKRGGINSGAMGFDYSSLLELWTAPVGSSPPSVALTWANSVVAAGADAARVAIQAFSYTAYDTSTPIGATASDTTLGTSGTGAMTLSAAPASNSVVVAARKIEQDGTNDITATHGAGWSEIYDFAAVSGSEGYACLETQERTGSASTSVVWTEINANSLAVFGEAMGLAIEIRMAAGDTTAPTLSSASGSGSTLACAGSVSTDEGNGTLYAVFTASATAPSAAQVKAGQDHTGAAALRAVSQAVSGTGVQNIASGAITAGTRYAHFMHEDAATNQSTVASSSSFEVEAPAAAPLRWAFSRANRPGMGPYSTGRYFRAGWTPFPLTQITLGIAQVLEADAAQPMGARLALAIGQAQENDAAQALSVRLTRVLGQAQESDAAIAFAAALRLAIGQAQENDAALALTPAQARAIAQAQEQDAAQALTARLAAGIGQAQEQDAAQQLTLAGGPLILGQALEQDAAQPLQARVTAALGQAAEQDAAQPFTARATAAVGQAQEADEALALAAQLRQALGQALEQDSAQPLTFAAIQSIGQAEEADTAQAFTFAGPVGIVQVQERDEALPFTVAGPSAPRSLESGDDDWEDPLAHRIREDDEVLVAMMMAAALVASGAVHSTH